MDIVDVEVAWSAVVKVSVKAVVVLLVVPPTVRFRGGWPDGPVSIFRPRRIKQ